MAKNELVIGNLNCVFISEYGKKGFLDVWELFVKNCFIDDISFGKRPRFLFKDIKITKLNSGEPAIIGKFVKDTELVVNQKLKDDKLVETFESYESAPSSIFVYLLKSHTVLFMGEHRGHPRVESLRTFFKNIIERERKQFIRTMTKDMNDVEKHNFVKEYPPAYVTFTPLPLNGNIDKEFSDVKKIKEFTIRQFVQNGNFDTSSYISENHNFMERIKAKMMDIKTTNVEDIEGTKEVVKNIGSTTEASFSINCITKSGQKKVITPNGTKCVKKVSQYDHSNDIISNANMLNERYVEGINNNEYIKVIDKNSDDLISKVDFE